MNPLETRRQRLVAASELNRAQLLAECRTMAEAVGGVARRAKSLGALAASVSLLVADLAAFRRSQSAGAGRSPWMQRLIQAVRWGGALWLAWRARADSTKKNTD